MSRYSCAMAPLVAELGSLPHVWGSGTQFRVVQLKGSSMKQALRRQLAVVSAGALGAVSSVHAAVPAAVDTALADMKTDGVAVATLVLVAIIAVAAILFMRRAIK